MRSFPEVLIRSCVSFAMAVFLGMGPTGLPHMQSLHLKQTASRENPIEAFNLERKLSRSGSIQTLSLFSFPDAPRHNHEHCAFCSGHMYSQCANINEYVSCLPALDIDALHQETVHISPQPVELATSARSPPLQMSDRSADMTAGNSPG